MSLQFIIGSSGAGKSYFAYERVIRESMDHPERNYYIIVPEQFTMQTQKTLVEMHPGKGILNIDILSFERLVFCFFVVFCCALNALRTVYLKKPAEITDRSWKIREKAWCCRKWCSSTERNLPIWEVR